MTVEDLKKELPVRKVLESYGLVFNRSGFSRCPFHDETHGSLKLYEKTNSWYCFGCMNGGDIISFVALYENIPPRKAMDKLCDDFKLEHVTYTYNPKREPTEKEKLDHKIECLLRAKRNWEKIKNNEIPKLLEGRVEFSDLYANACQILPKIEYELDVLLGIEH